MIACESEKVNRHANQMTTTPTTTPTPTTTTTTRKSEFKHRILNTILSRFTSHSNHHNHHTQPSTQNSTTSTNNNRTTPTPLSSHSRLHNRPPSSTSNDKDTHRSNVNNSSSSSSSSKPTYETATLQKFSDKRIADLIRETSNHNNRKLPYVSNIHSSGGVGVNYSVNESRLREMCCQTPHPANSSQNQYYQMPLFKPVALRPKKPDSDMSHSFRLSTHDQPLMTSYADPQRNSRFINRRSTIARSEYANDGGPPILMMTNTDNKPPQPKIAASTRLHYETSNKMLASTGCEDRSGGSSREVMMMMRPRLNLIKMKIHNLIENKPASFEAIQEVKESQLRQQRQFQLNSTGNHRQSPLMTNATNHLLKLDRLLGNVVSDSCRNSGTSCSSPLTVNKPMASLKVNENCGSNMVSSNNGGGSLVSLTSSTSSLLSSSASSLTSAVAFATDVDPIYNKFRIDEPKIDLELIENDDL